LLFGFIFTVQAFLKPYTVKHVGRRAAEMLLKALIQDLQGGANK
jgi:hypothetical protein